MKKQDLFKEIGSIDEQLIKEADILINMSFFKKPWIKFVSIAACIALIFGIGIFSIYNQSNKIELSPLSNNVSVKYVKKTPGLTTSSDLLELSEQELFSKYNTSIFKGIIIKIENIEIKLNGKKQYNAIAEIKVEKTYRGNCKIDDTVSVLLPCPIANGVWVEDTQTISAMQVGMTGIFMPIKYGNDSFYESNGAKLALKDIADYGFADGSRYVFLESEEGVIFSKWAYKSIETVTSLVEIENYIESMIS